MVVVVDDVLLLKCIVCMCVFLYPLSMATGSLSALLQPLGGRSGVLRAQPEVLQAHGDRN